MCSTTTREKAYYSSPVGDSAGRVLDAIRFHSLGAILNWLAGSFCLDLMSLVFLVRELTELVSIL